MQRDGEHVLTGCRLVAEDGKSRRGRRSVAGAVIKMYLLMELSP
jgi:hypothetical protein